MRDRVRRAFLALNTGLPWVLGIVALVHPLARLGARWDWRLDLITHFQEPALVVTLIAAVVCLRRHQRAAIVLLLLAVFQCDPVVRYSWSKPLALVTGTQPRLRILLANVLINNSRYDSLGELIHRVNPDIVGLVEFSEEWEVGTRSLAKEFPYRIEAPNGSRGLALWSKLPLLTSDPVARPTRLGWPFLHATFAFAGVTRNLWLLHPAAPFSRNDEDENFGEFRAIADRIRATGGSTVLLGDLNTTDGSPHFAAFLDKTRLKDSRLGFGRQATWPVGSPYKIAIDHVFVSDDFQVIDRHRELSIGSDHLPILVDLAATASSAADRAGPPSPE